MGLIISRPLFENQKSASIVHPDLLDHQRSTLLADRDRILNALQELDFDHALGKIPENEYPKQRALLMGDGAEVLRQLDSLEERPDSVEMDTRLEAAIAARRADISITEGVLEGVPTGSTVDPTAEDGGLQRSAANTPVSDPDDELEVLIANRRRARQEKSAGFCHKCGGPLQLSDRFCPKCGASLE